MSEECELLENCGFVKKYHDSKDLAVKGFISMYCKTEKQAECKRKEYRAKEGMPPLDDMMPTGHIMVS
jgi:hypothetical protein